MEYKNNSQTVRIEITNRELLLNSKNYIPVLDNLLYWYSNIYRSEGVAVPEPFIGAIVGEARKNLNNLTTQDNQSRSDRLETILWDLVPGKEKLFATKDEFGIKLDTIEENRMLSGTLKDVAIDDRSKSNQLPRIWAVYNNGTLNWLLNTANEDDFGKFVNEVSDGYLSPHFISKDEVDRVNQWVHGDRSVKPAIAVFIGEIKSGKSYDDAIKSVNSTFPKSEIVNEYGGKESPLYEMSKISK